MGTGGGIAKGARRRWGPQARRGVWLPEVDNPGPMDPARAPDGSAPPTRWQDQKTPRTEDPPTLRTSRAGIAERARETEPALKNRGPPGAPQGTGGNGPKEDCAAPKARASPKAEPASPDRSSLRAGGNLPGRAR